MKDTIIYLRTSTEEQNPENQLKDCEALALKLELKDYEVLQEQQSAFKDIDRKVFESIREAIKKKEIKSLICWDLDRLFRNRKKLVQFFEFCKIYNCKIYSARQEWLEGINNIQEPFNEIVHNLMLQVMGWLAEDESKKKSMRVKSAVVRKDKKGNIIPTISYKGNKWGRKTILSIKLKQQAQEFRNQGLSLNQIAEQMKISKSSVFKLLSEFNEGNTAKNKEVLN